MVESLKISLRVGDLKLKYDGSEEFFENRLPALLEQMLQSNLATVPTKVDHHEVGNALPNTSLGIDLSMQSVAAKLMAESGRDLAMAAMAKLYFSDSIERVSRKQILSEMQAVPSRYKKSMSSNLSTILERMVKDNKLNGLTNSTYSLPESQIEELRVKLG